MNEIFNPNNSSFLTAIATVLLVLVGLVQIFVLYSQKKQTRIALTEKYRQLWNDLKIHWGNIVFIGREAGEYYQVLDSASINSLKNRIINSKNAHPAIWALESIHKVCGLLGEVSTRILQDHLKVADIYPVFGTEFLRQSRPLRMILDSGYPINFATRETTEEHRQVRRELQTWLIYHEGLRRRCLILIDLLWAEAARLEDLPPEDMKSAADAKKQTGQINRKRVFQESIRLNGGVKIFYALSLSRFLGKAEYRSWKNWAGINKKRLSILNKGWTERLLGDKYRDPILEVTIKSSNWKDNPENH